MAKVVFPLTSALLSCIHLLVIGLVSFLDLQFSGNTRPMTLWRIQLAPADVRIVPQRSSVVSARHLSGAYNTLTAMMLSMIC